MLRDAIANADLAVWPQIALLLFMAVFILAAAWLMLPGQRVRLAQAAQLPLHDEDQGASSSKEELP